ncbi:hypothetical protein C5B42_02220 [Candidatus Cerribacteria bacterium 'Amazon FNV 2010 28 9']|uniref:Uncharacterized protein n=1 Tax=Candidatus Cerribacteria bacterium 'Amazon FNV 2010 28 9' TaxID=2081795 RepID=A0A317JUA0_9BACT|nr:MAG: hypothetical protein C5B42_02220 [Candidatus Cerribacteria bacterium 'Amazon FNV 2010 28 9']
MSDANQTPSLDAILDQLEKTTGISTTSPAPTAPVIPPMPAAPNPMVATPATQPAPTPESAPAPTMEPVTAPAAPVIASKPTPSPIASMQQVEQMEKPIGASTSPAPMPMPEPVPLHKESADFSAQHKPDVGFTAPIAETPAAPAKTPQATSPTKAKRSFMPFALAGIGALVVVAGLAIGLYLQYQNQNNQGQAYTPVATYAPAPVAPTTTPVEQPTTQPVATPTLAVNPGNLIHVTGSICNAPTTEGGNVYLYNLDKKIVANIPIPQGQTTFQSLFPTGTVVAYYRSVSGNLLTGATDSTTHILTKISLDEQHAGTPIKLCDPQMDTTSMPQDTFTPMQQQQ